MKLVDDESGLYSRLHLIHYLNESYARARRYDIPLSCIMFQVIWWRGLEEYGHEKIASSQAIRELAHHLLLNVRTGDIIGRWSKNEYLLVSSCTPPKAVKAMAINLAKKLENYEFHALPGFSVSIRAGVSGLPDHEKRVRYAEDLPLIAHYNLGPIFQMSEIETEEYKTEGLEAIGEVSAIPAMNEF